jgi:Protein of unknown function (DUF3096)
LPRASPGKPASDHTQIAISRVYACANTERKQSMIDIVYIQPLVALIFGILILFIPRALNYLVAIYLILIGVMGLYPHFAHTIH